MVKLNIGCGTDKQDGFVNIDVSEIVQPDLVLDCTTYPWPYEDGGVSQIRAVDFFEHVFNPIPCFNECWRVLAPEGTLYIEVPLAGTVDYYKDPTHVRPFVPQTFKYFAEWNFPAYGIKPWKILTMRHTTGEENQNRVFVIMQPVK
jgi:predicted SAM-dependent methyltransferase